MAKVLERGTAHKRAAWFITCNFCESKLRIFEDGYDPAVESVEWVGQRDVCYRLVYTCPVCNQQQRIETNHQYSHSYEDDYGNVRKEVLLTREDKLEIEENKKMYETS